MNIPSLKLTVLTWKWILFLFERPISRCKLVVSFREGNNLLIWPRCWKHSTPKKVRAYRHERSTTLRQGRDFFRTRWKRPTKASLCGWRWQNSWWSKWGAKRTWDDEYDILHPGNWSPKWRFWKMIFLLKWVILRFYWIFGRACAWCIPYPISKQSTSECGSINNGTPYTSDLIGPPANHGTLRWLNWCLLLLLETHTTLREVEHMFELVCLCSNKEMLGHLGILGIKTCILIVYVTVQ